MNGVFDLGGTDGFGPVNHVAEEPPFRSEWEKSAVAMFFPVFRAGWLGIDEFRHGVERMDPVDYLTSPYYNHWVHTMEHYGRVRGFLDPAELDRRTQHYLEHPDAPLPAHEPRQDLVDFVDAVVFEGAGATRPTDKQPRFTAGDAVRTKSVAPFGHTRLARYVRGKVGEVVAHRGSFVYPDTAGNGLGENPEHVYTVKFDARELWGDEYADRNSSVCFDVWDPYIEHADKTGGATA